MTSKICESLTAMSLGFLTANFHSSREIRQLPVTPREVHKHAGLTNVRAFGEDTGK